MSEAYAVKTPEAATPAGLRVVRKPSVIREEKPAWQTRVDSYIATFATARFFQPDGNPKMEWNGVFFGETPEAARELAKRAPTDETGDLKYNAGLNGILVAVWAAANEESGMGAGESISIACKTPCYTDRNVAVAEAGTRAMAAWKVALEGQVGLNSLADLANFAMVYAQYLAVSDLDVGGEEKREEYARELEERREAFEKGYVALNRGSNGRLNVYAKSPDAAREGFIARLIRKLEER